MAEAKKRHKPIDVLPDIIPGLLVAWREVVEGVENLAANPHAQSGDVEAALRALREDGYSQIDSVKALRHAMKLTLREADDLVLNSEAWRDHRERTMRLREIFFDAWGA